MRKNDNVKEAPAKNEGFATFTIAGTVESVYDGKKADYARIRVTRDEWYTDFNVGISKNVGIEAGDKVQVSGNINVFYDRDSGTYRTTYSAESVKEI